MNKISGRITLKESGVGIPDLLVAIFDLDPGTSPEEIIGKIAAGTTLEQISQNIPADRLGTVRTRSGLPEETGTFELMYEDSEFQIRNDNEKRPDLFLMVLAPEEPGKDLTERTLFVSTAVRQNAGRTEEFLIWLTIEQLKYAGIPIPSSQSQVAEEPDDVIARLAKVEKKRTELNTGLSALNTKRIERVQARTLDFEKRLKPQLAKALSTVSDKLAATKTFVADGQSVTDKNLQAIKNGIQRVINVADDSKVRAPVVGRVRLSEAQKGKLTEFKNKAGDFVDVPDDVLEPILFGSTDDNQAQTIFLRKNPLDRLCRDQTIAEKCLDGEDKNPNRDSGNGDDVTDGGGNPGGMNIIEALGPGVDVAIEALGLGVDVASEDDIPRYISRLMGQLNAPEEPVVFGEVAAGKRADQDDIQRRIDALSFRRGPADVPAFYDFHNLQIAFDHVWQEAIDHGVLDLAENAYNEIVELGGKPVVTSVKGLVAYGWTFLAAVASEPPDEVIQIFNITRAQWNVLSETQKSKLQELSKLFFIESDAPDNELNTGTSRGKPGEDARLPVSAPDVGSEPIRRSAFITWRQWGERIIRFAQSELEARKEAEVQGEISGLQSFSKLQEILRQLEQRIDEDYPFTIYAANRHERSVNFGIMITYRQKWEPVTYQVGELVKTITLAPKEIRKFSKKVVTKRSRSRKEVEDSLASRKEEASNTSRAEAEIVRNAQAKTNFNLTAQGTYNVGISEGTATTVFGGDASKTSNEVKKEFREAVSKSAQEYRDERKVEVSTEESFEEELVESGEIMNPNDELPVTFLFYELQRRFRVSEHIYRILPVVLVAQEVPAPHEIDEAWLIAYDWILRRFLLDDTFRPALNYLSTLVGDEYALKEMRKNIELQRRLTEQIKEEVVAYRELVGQQYSALERAIERSAQAAQSPNNGGLFGSIGDLLPGTRLVEKGLEFLTGDSSQGSEAAQIRERAARDAYEKAMQDERDMMARLNREVTALNALTEAYTNALSGYLNRKTQISRLRVHIKQNILYYMQAIWLMEPNDQRFFRLHKVQVPDLTKKTKSLYKVKGKATFRTFIDPTRPKAKEYEFTVNTQIEPAFKTVDLVEVAALDNLLGFKGNYMMFPLKKRNALTRFMMAPYLEQAWELYDPDVAGNMTLDEFSDYVCCLKDKLSPRDFDAAKPELKELLETLLTSPLRNNEEIVVPTDSLFIEALPGVHPILEDFKLIHRAIDVKNAQEDVRRKGLENIRLAYRLLDKQLEDPDIEAKYVFEGDGTATVIPPGSRGNGG